jgi:hypothetical protein
VTSLKRNVLITNFNKKNMTNNFIQIEEKGNYFVITTGWNDLLNTTRNYTGQYDFPKENTSVNGIKRITPFGVENNGLTIVNENTNKKISIQRTINTTTTDDMPVQIDNEFYLFGESVTFDMLLDWLFQFTGVTTLTTR